MEKIMTKERRTKTQIFFDVITAVIDDTQNSESMSPTRITERGMEFHKDYSRINDLINEMNEKF